MKSNTKILFALGLLLVLLTGGLNLVSAQPDPANQDPILMYLSGFTGLKTETILNYQTEGFHLGDVAQAYHLNQDEETLDLSPILNLAKEVGWGAAYQQLGYQPGEHKGLGWLFKEEGKPGNTPDKDKDTNPPDQANNDKDKDTNPPDQANNDKDKDTSPPDHANNDKDKDDKDKDKDKDKP